MYVTQALARYAASLQKAPPPEEVLHHAKRAVVDWFASAFAGLSVSPVPMLERVLADDLGHGAATLLRGGAATPRAAALIHGAAAHAAEVDDSFRDAMYHPGAATVAAALAAAQQAGCSGLRFLRGVIAGYEISTRIGVALGRSHYLYWHNSGTVGTFGAAAAAGVVLGLDEAGHAHALATAATFAAGLQQAFRTDSMSKPLHTGRAAEGGCLAAQLAAAGVTGGADVLEGDSGFGVAMSDEADWSHVACTLGRDFHIARLTVKNHVGCGHTFAAVDAALELRRAHPFAIEDISGIAIETYRPALDIACHVLPETANEARFSMRYVVATALVDGSLRQQAYTPARMADPVVRRLMACTQVAVDPELDDAFPRERSARVTLTLTDGTRLVHLQRHRKGDPELPLRDDELNAKFIELVAPVVGETPARELLAQLWRLELRSDVLGLGRP
ncbi:MmgE/PrpD family protein [Trinickia sp. Y13]|uniref:MmgE/PrpD family protein n=1 Tax=Trinickia sp. Y13 TaxID=2917807 RepID=UPI0024063781|nr:MmgE/PrpD family protein [Trinickia sp. Y13]MDG0027320.1 MmgE/PrpD family protein [Trinickia sp. Y13]